jgi:hypothetical protein
MSENIGDFARAINWHGAGLRAVASNPTLAQTKDITPP